MSGFVLPPFSREGVRGWVNCSCPVDILRLHGARPRDVLPGSFHLDPPPGFRTADLSDLARAGMVLFGEAPTNPAVDTSPQLQ